MGCQNHDMTELPALSDDRVRFGPYELHPVQRRLTRDGDEVNLGGRAFDILVALVERAFARRRKMDE